MIFNGTTSTSKEIERTMEDTLIDDIADEQQRKANAEQHERGNEVEFDSHVLSRESVLLSFV